jgi:hypothetical protein
MLLLGEDLIRGVNFASKKRPLVSYWFRLPPKVIVEPTNPFEREKDFVDLTLIELEKAWLPTGKVSENKHLDIADKFDTINKIRIERKEEENRIREETIDDIAARRRLEAQKKEAIIKKMEKEKKRKAKQQRDELKERRNRAKLEALKQE